MASLGTDFFATRRDLEEVLRAVESATALQYVEAGLFEGPPPAAMDSLLAWPDLGVSKHGDQAHEVTFLVAERGARVEVREVPQRRGGVRHAIDQQINPATISLCPGGVFGDAAIIAGSIGTISGDAASRALFRLFDRAIASRFEKIRSYRVGAEAAAMLDAGARLTARVKAPPLYDLARR